ncbi:hypothetical protein ACYP3S_26740, partial [Klebsiella pneumoniae]
NVTPAYWAANGHQRQINSDIFKFITSVWGILVHAVGKKAPSGALCLTPHPWHGAGIPESSQ